MYRISIDQINYFLKPKTNNENKIRELILLKNGNRIIEGVGDLVFNDYNFEIDDVNENLKHFSKKYNVQRIFLVDKNFLDDLIASIKTDNYFSQISELKNELLNHAIPSYKNTDAHVQTYSDISLVAHSNFYLFDFFEGITKYPKFKLVIVLEENSKISMIGVNFSDSQIVDFHEIMLPEISKSLLDDYETKSAIIHSHLEKLYKTKVFAVFSNYENWQKILNTEEKNRFRIFNKLISKKQIFIEKRDFYFNSMMFLYKILGKR